MIHFTISTNLFLFIQVEKLFRMKSTVKFPTLTFFLLLGIFTWSWTLAHSVEISSDASDKMTEDELDKFLDFLEKCEEESKKEDDLYNMMLVVLGNRGIENSAVAQLLANKSVDLSLSPSSSSAPQCPVLHLAKLWFQNPKDYWAIFPYNGFLDTQNPQTEIAHSKFFNRTLERGVMVFKILLTIEYQYVKEGANNQEFLNLVSYTTKFVQNTDFFLRDAYFILVVTRVPSLDGKYRSEAWNFVKSQRNDAVLNEFFPNENDKRRAMDVIDAVTYGSANSSPFIETVTMWKDQMEFNMRESYYNLRQKAFRTMFNINNTLKDFGRALSPKASKWLEQLENAQFED